MDVACESSSEHVRPVDHGACGSIWLPQLPEDNLAWEPAPDRNNDEFPHYYGGPLPTSGSAVTRVLGPLHLDDDGAPQLPAEFQE